MSLVSAVPDKHENKIQNEKKGEMRRARGWKKGHEKKVTFAFIFVTSVTSEKLWISKENTSHCCALFSADLVCITMISGSVQKKNVSCSHGV